MTINDLQPQNYKKSNYHNIQSTPLPVFSSQTIKQVKWPQRMNNFLGIEHILQQPSISDTIKLDQLIHKLNGTGSLSRVNVFNRTWKNDVGKSTLQTEYDHQKDAKELKVQFVLDCGLKEMANKNPQAIFHSSPLSTVKKVPIQYPTYSNAVFNRRVTTKPPNRLTKKGVVYYGATTSKPVRVATTAKQRIKHIYVDPPLVGEISDTFENVYNYFENAMTTKVKVKPQQNQEDDKERPIKRSTAGNSITAPPTVAPNYRYTQSYGSQNGQKLTTKIHVTSEYVGEDPGTKRPYRGEDDASLGSDSFSDEYYSGFDDDGSDDDDDDDDYDRDDRDEGDDYYNFSLSDGEDDDVSVKIECISEYSKCLSWYLILQDYDDDVYAKKPPHKIKNNRSKKRKRKIEKKRKKNSISDSESDEDGFDGLPVSNMGTLFQRTYETLSGFVPALPSIFGSDDDTDDDEDDNEEVEALEKRKPKLKHSLYSKQPFKAEIQQKNKNNRWFDKFFLGSDDVEETTPIPIPKIKVTTEPGFFDWLGGSDDVTTDKVAVEQTQTEKSRKSPLNCNFHLKFYLERKLKFVNTFSSFARFHSFLDWFSNLFSNSESTTTTTIKPDPVEVTTEKLSSSLDSKKWFELLTAHMATMQTPATATTVNRTNVLRRVKYDDYQIWRIIPSTQAQLEFLREYKNSDENENVLWLKGPAMR